MKIKKKKMEVKEVEIETIINHGNKSFQLYIKYILFICMNVFHNMGLLYTIKTQASYGKRITNIKLNLKRKKSNQNR